jgi:hypothetical protein
MLVFCWQRQHQAKEMPIPELDLAIRNLLLKLGLGSVIE